MATSTSTGFFKEYSGTAGAREDFIAEIKKKESETVALKTVVFTTKAEIAKLRQEREFALTLPSLFETRKSIEDAAAQKAEPQAAAGQEPAPAPGIAVSTSDAASLEPQAAAGQEPAPAPVIAVSTSDAAGLEPQAAAQAAAAPVQQEAGTIDMPGVGRVPLSHFKFSISTSVPEIDAALMRKDSDLKRSEDYLRVFQKQAERELLEYESHKTEILLGRIYVALKELAVKEEISVVVDKRNVLFGQPAVDLTGKLLAKLEGEGS